MKPKHEGPWLFAILVLDILLCWGLAAGLGYFYGGQ